jgi:REP element-mobilizing transposase RayT
MLERLALLTKMFAIDIAAYALMSNHYHLVVRVDTAKAATWNAIEIAERWQMLFQIPDLVGRYLQGELSGNTETQLAETIIETWHKRLCDISWFMRCMNEHIARLANKEDQCTGRFWEGRFKCQALLDEKALLTAMVYVDLNPIRAKTADTPESSNYTSIQQRLGQTIHSVYHGPLLPFSGQSHQGSCAQHIPFHFIDYIELVDWTGRQLRAKKYGVISKQHAPILSRLGILPNGWLHNCEQLEQNFYHVIGPISLLKEFCERIGLRWLHGQTACRRSFG